MLLYLFCVTLHQGNCVTLLPWLESVFRIDRHGRDALYIYNLSGCEQFVCCPTHIAGNRPVLVKINVPDRINMFVGTPLRI